MEPGLGRVLEGDPGRLIHGYQGWNATSLIGKEAEQDVERH